MIEKFEGIVLRTLKYNDGLMIADIYTAQRGRMSFLVPVSHSKRSKVRSVLFQPLSMLSFTATVKAGRNLSRIAEAQPYAMYCSIPNDVVKSSIALYLAELLTFALREDGRDDALFTFLDRSFMLFDNLEQGYADFHLVFMVQLLRFLGIYPNLENYVSGCYFDLMQGYATREHPLHPHFLSPDDAIAFVELLRTEYSSMHLLSLNRVLRGEFLATLSLYYKLHIPEFPELKSAAILRELFD
jgi:DNA repair protein RecO (recombination protein O)